MFNFLKKKKPTAKDRFIEDKDIACEMAKKYINDVDGIMFRYKYWLSEIGKDQSEEEKAHINWIKKRQEELWQEKRDVKLDNVAINNKIIKVYSKLMNEYFAMPEKTDKQIAENGLPEKYVTTKVDLSEFDQEVGA